MLSCDTRLIKHRQNLHGMHTDTCETSSSPSMQEVPTEMGTNGDDSFVLKDVFFIRYDASKRSRALLGLSSRTWSQ